MQINLNDKSVENLIKKLTLYAGSEKLKNAVGKATEAVRGYALEEAPVDTGNLRLSIKKDIKQTKNGVTGKVYTRTKYAQYVEFGTGVKGAGTYPYKIKGVNLTYKDKGWAYFDSDNDKWIYTKGQKAKPFMYPALYNHKDKVMKVIKSEMEKK